MIFQILDWKVPFVKQLSGYWKARNFVRGQNYSSNKCNELLILIKIKFKEKYIIFKCRLYYYYLESSTKWFGINNRDVPFLSYST